MRSAQAAERGGRAEAAAPSWSTSKGGGLSTFCPTARNRPWPRGRPEITVETRDRWSEHARAVTAGAPGALQISDIPTPAASSMPGPWRHRRAALRRARPSPRGSNEMGQRCAPRSRRGGAMPRSRIRSSAPTSSTTRPAAAPASNSRAAASSICPDPHEATTSRLGGRSCGAMRSTAAGERQPGAEWRRHPDPHAGPWAERPRRGPTIAALRSPPLAARSVVASPPRPRGAAGRPSLRGWLGNSR